MLHPNWRSIFLLILANFAKFCLGILDLPPPCDSKIYCLSSNTSLLHVVQMAKLYKDSKTFVDKAIKTTPEEVLANFDTLMKVRSYRFLEVLEEVFLRNNQFTKIS